MKSSLSQRIEIDLIERCRKGQDSFKKSDKLNKTKEELLETLEKDIF